MKNFYITLSANTLSATETLPEVTFYDKTTLNISLSGVSESLPPLYVDISWGDENVNVYYNDPYKQYRNDNIIPEILNEQYSRIYTQRFINEFRPTETLYTSLTSVICVVYPFNQTTTFILPIKIRKNDYFENFGDVTLNSVRLTENSKREFQFSAESNDKIFENETLD
jgi:hypothetical protein